jgi:hypothetical protein
MDLITIMLAGLMLVAAAARAQTPAMEALGQDQSGGGKGESGDEAE